jgi:hypothetical protein
MHEAVTGGGGHSKVCRLETLQGPPPTRAPPQERRSQALPTPCTHQGALWITRVDLYEGGATRGGMCRHHCCRRHGGREHGWLVDVDDNDGNLNTGAAASGVGGNQRGRQAAGRAQPDKNRPQHSHERWDASPTQDADAALPGTASPWCHLEVDGA